MHVISPWKRRRKKSKVAHFSLSWSLPTLAHWDFVSTEIKDKVYECSVRITNVIVNRSAKCDINKIYYALYNIGFLKYVILFNVIYSLCSSSKGKIE